MLRARSNTALSLLSLFALFALLLGNAPLAAAQEGASRGDASGFTATPLPDSAFEGTIESTVSKTEFADSDYVNYLVKISDASLATYDGSIPGLAATSPKVTGKPLDVSSPESVAYLAYLNGKIDALVANLQAAIPGLRVGHRFDVVLGGVSVQLPQRFLERLPFVSGVSGVLADDLMTIDTFNSPQFIGAPTTWRRLGGQEKAGEGVIVGILDSGIWPETDSFADPDPSGKPFATPRPRTDGTPWPCDFSSGTNPGAPFSCNNKLISAQRFMDTYEAVIGLEPYEFTSARDDDGHGSHTASTAAGNYGVSVKVGNRDFGEISGISPRSHVVAYKVCGEQGCFGSDSAAAIEQSIVDGVDVLNFSISGGANPYSDAVSLAFLEAYDAGIFVAASAGNSGPTAETVAHRGPWITTVAASTQNRGYLSTVSLTGSAGATLTLVGGSQGDGVATPSPVVINTADILCQSPAAPGSFAGKIVVCRRGVNARTDKSANVAAGGAVGMLLYNPGPSSVDTDLHSIPTVHFDGGPGSAGEQLLAFLAANPSTSATFTAGVIGDIQGDVIAGFSSRGGPNQTLGVSKPDITAIGVNVLAGYTGEAYGVTLPGPFSFLSGTSMSSPHIAGTAALLKDLHPDWTPGQIKSALMTTAKVAGLVKEDGVTPATAFDTGSGRVDMTRAWNPGLTFDETAANYRALEAELWNANYPSLYIPRMPGIITVKRTATNVTGDDEEFELRVSYPAGQPKDWSVKVPSELEIDEKRSKSFEITVDARDVPLGATRFATILITSEDRKSALRFPVTIVRRQADLAVTTSCDPATIIRGNSTSCTVNMTNNSSNDANVSMLTQLPKELQLVASSVTGGTAVGRDRVRFTGTIPARRPTDVSATINPLASPAGFLPLSGFGIAPIGGVGDETISNFNVPAFSYGGKTYTRIGIVSNGYVVLGGGTGADIDFVNTSLPNPAAPNNVLAPFWSDLNPGAAGAIRIGTLGDGVNSWIVVDFAGVANFSAPATQRNSFQVWISYTQPDDVSFTYGTVTGGDGGFLTVGAENEEGNTGTTIFLNGAPAANAPRPSNATGYEIDVTAAPGQTFSQSVGFSATGRQKGPYTLYSFVQANTFQGTAVGRFAGEVLPRPED